MGAMAGRWWIPLVLLLLAGASSWWLAHLEKSERAAARGPHEPDFFMEDPTRITMDVSGRIKERLHADYMEHFPDDESTTLVRPRLELYNSEGVPWHVTAERGRVDAHGDVVLLQGKVHIWRNDNEGRREVKVLTEDLRVFPKKDYADTEKPSTIISPSSVSHGVGMRVYLKEKRLALLSEVKTHYEPNKKSSP